MWNFFKLFDELYRQIRETHSSNTRVRRADNNIGTDSPGTLARILDEAMAESNERQHQRYWNGNQQNAQECADRPLTQVRKN